MLRSKEAFDIKVNQNVSTVLFVDRLCKFLLRYKCFCMFVLLFVQSHSPFAPLLDEANNVCCNIPMCNISTNVQFIFIQQCTHSTLYILHIHPILNLFSSTLFTLFMPSYNSVFYVSVFLCLSII